jgi:hypothetical protein
LHAARSFFDLLLLAKCVLTAEASASREAHADARAMNEKSGRRRPCLLVAPGSIGLGVEWECFVSRAG